MGGSNRREEGVVPALILLGEFGNRYAEENVPRTSPDGDGLRLYPMGRVDRHRGA